MYLKALCIIALCSFACADILPEDTVIQKKAIGDVFIG
jgi:hypothetical protein